LAEWVNRDTTAAVPKNAAVVSFSSFVQFRWFTLSPKLSDNAREKTAKNEYEQVIVNRTTQMVP
jgi:hypothetical protein